MDEPWNHAEWKKSTQKVHIVWVHLHGMCRIGNVVETESRLVIDRGWKGLLNSTGYPLGVMKNVLELGGGHGCTCDCTKRHWIVHFKMQEIVNFILGEKKHAWSKSEPPCTAALEMISFVNLGSSYRWDIYVLIWENFIIDIK